MPPMRTDTGACGSGEVPTGNAPVRLRGLVTPCPVAYSTTTVPGVAGFSVEFAIPSWFQMRGNRPGLVAATGLVTVSLCWPLTVIANLRSEERRVGKECRSLLSRY